MFKENQEHLQYPLFSTVSSMPAKYKERLEESWASTFYEELFARIEEKDFVQ